MVNEYYHGSEGKFLSDDEISVALPSSSSDSWNYKKEVQDPLIRSQHQKSKFSTSDVTSASLPSSSSDSWKYKEEVQDPLIVGSLSWKRQILGKFIIYHFVEVNNSIVI